MDKKLIEILSRIKTSKEYGSIDEQVLLRVARQEMGKGKNVADDVKRVKTYLHIMYGAFNKDVNFEKIYQHLQGVQDSQDASAVKKALQQAMQASASSGERLAIIDDFYKQIFAITGFPASIIDVACGLNPLSIVLLDFPKDISYHAFDIGRKEIEFLNKAFLLFGYDQAKAGLNDVISTVPDKEADVALILKTVPLIERQKKGVSTEIIKKLKAKHVVVSFPTLNLGVVKKQKGMKGFYEKQFYEMIKGRSWKTEQLLFNNEMAFVIKK